MEESIHHNSSHFAAISDASPVQARVIEALAAEMNDGIHELAAHALLTLHDLLRDPATPHAVRLNTALAILQRPHAPNPGWNLPGPVESASRNQYRRNANSRRDRARRAANSTPSAAPIARCGPCPVTPDANPRAA